MPAYAVAVGSNPLPETAIPGKPAYFFGSYPADTQDTIAYITNVALTSNVATITVQITGGNIPAVGNLITVQNASNSAFNVSSATITGVTITASTGAGTITYAVTHADVASAAATGSVYIPIAEVAEAVVASGSCIKYVPSQEPNDHGVRSITVATTFPTIQATTGAATVTLYTAIKDPGVAPGTAGSEWTSMGTVAVVAAGAQTQGPLQTYTVPAGRFFGVAISGVTGTSTIICKMIS